MNDSFWNRIESLLREIRASAAPQNPDPPLEGHPIYTFHVGYTSGEPREAFGHWNSVCTRLGRWSRNGVWALMLELLPQERNREGLLLYLNAADTKGHPNTGRVGVETSTSATGEFLSALNAVQTFRWLAFGLGEPGGSRDHLRWHWYSSSRSTSKP